MATFKCQQKIEEYIEYNKKRLTKEKMTLKHNVKSN